MFSGPPGTPPLPFPVLDPSSSSTGGGRLFRAGAKGVGVRDH
jgi:hypothetical protein